MEEFSTLQISRKLRKEGPVLGRAFTSTLIVAVMMQGLATSGHAETRWQRKVSRLVRKDKEAMQSLGTVCFQAAMLDHREMQCDSDGDNFTNFREGNLPRKNGKRVRISYRKADTDADGITDWDELMVHGTNPHRKDSDRDGINDNDEIRAGSDPMNPDSNGDGIPDGQDGNGGCTPPNFDVKGDTSKFGIPAGTVGNSARGQAMYNSSCVPCHQGTERGTNLTYPQLNAALSGQTGTPMRFNIPAQKVADLVAWLNRSQTGGTGVCPTPTPGGTPSDSTPTATPTASPSPQLSPTTTPTPCPGGSSSVNFDGQGNTTSFSIPNPIVGNVSSGQTQYTSTCVSCHLVANGEKGSNLNFTQLKTAFTTNMFMNGTLGGPLNLNDQQVANLTAFLNRFNLGGCTPGSSPTPTPTPTATPDPISRGAAIFAAACVECHSIGSSGRPREMDRHPSLNKIHEALRQGPDEMPTFHSLTLGPSAPPYSQSEQDLWAYLHSLP